MQLGSSKGDTVGMATEITKLVNAAVECCAKGECQ